MANKLSPQQLNFVQLYALSGNAKQAAIQAGYSARSAEMQGSRLLSNDNVQQELFKLQQKTEKKFELKRERIIQELCAIAFGNMIDIFRWDAETAQFIPRNDLTRDQAAFIDSIQVSEQFEEVPNDNPDGPRTVWKPVKKFKVVTLGREKVKALEALNRMMGFDKPSEGDDADFKKALRDAISSLDQKQIAEKSTQSDSDKI